MSRLGLITALTGLGLGLLSGCGGSDGASISGGGGPPPTDNNVATITVDAGPTVNGLPLNPPDANVLFTSVTICAPGSTTLCQTIDHIQVDTGSTGLRILASELSSSLNLPPVNTGNSGSPLAECYVFADGYIWGPIESADMQIAGESASSVELQVIGDPNYTTVPSDCSSVGGTNEDTVMAFGARGILGVAPFAQDCGSFCTAGAPAAWYYACPHPNSCQNASVSLIEQVLNPVTLFAADNNGVIIQLPTVSDAGAASVSGSLIFGIGTQSNNGIGSGLAVLLLDPTTGYFTTTYKGTALTQSYLDSGSNGLFFNDPSIMACTDAPDFFCPASTLNLTATNSSASDTGSGTSSVVNFSVANADALANNNPSFVAFSNLAGPASMNSPSQSFDWGLSFFYGRSVFTAVEGMNTPAGMGPYFAY